MISGVSVVTNDGLRRTCGPESFSTRETEGERGGRERESTYLTTKTYDENLIIGRANA